MASGIPASASDAPRQQRRIMTTLEAAGAGLNIAIINGGVVIMALLAMLL